ncbi:MAG: DUF3223 domain-containing protein [Desulfamplus sp.]|nr:DUF3223 domain-containing protein [Desulfamplus sp.]
MKKTFRIGQKEFKFKKDAIAHYRAILNAYDFGQSLNDSDFDDLIDLLNYAYCSDLAENENSEQNIEEEIYYDDNEEVDEDGLEIEDIKVAKVQFNTKCFEVFYTDNTSQYISYLMMINKREYNPENLFYIACRNSLHSDIRSVKQEYFDKYSVRGRVKCQETGELSKWTDLVVDHRQPNTFSIIVDRFKEVNRIDLDSVEFTSNEQNHIMFKDDNLTQEFKKYHKEKANLRIVRKECNSSRTGMARIKKTTKDLIIK